MKTPTYKLTKQMFCSHLLTPQLSIFTKLLQWARYVSLQAVLHAYLSTLTGGGRALETSEPLFPEVGMMVSPSDLSLSTKLSISFPLAPSFRALLGPLDLEEKEKQLDLKLLCCFVFPLFNQVRCDLPDDLVESSATQETFNLIHYKQVKNYFNAFII